MFHIQPAGLPDDPHWPADLTKLGYFINDNDQIRSIEHSEESFVYRISNKERPNDVHREAFRICVRREVRKRLKALGVSHIYLPNLSSSPPEPPMPFMPILTSNPALLRTKSRVIVIVNRRNEDLGIWSWRALTRDGGINGGSAVKFIKQALSRTSRGDDGDDNEETPGFVILNPGQRLFSHRHKRALTLTSWLALPRKSAAHPAPDINEVHNRIEGNVTPEEHIDYVFSKVLKNPEIVNPNAQLCLLGLVDGADLLLDYLASNWTDLAKQLHIAAVALTSPVSRYASTVSPSFREPDFAKFIANRAKAWVRSDLEVGTLVDVAELEQDQDSDAPEEFCETTLAFCPQVSGGEALNEEDVMPAAQMDILSWFTDVMHGKPNPGLAKLQIS